MNITYEVVSPSPIENTKTKKMLFNNVHKTYRITPIKGYELHDNRFDEMDENPETGEVITERFTSGSITIAAEYDFEKNPNNLYTRNVSNDKKMR